jgi:phage terminase small subunit
MDKDIKLTPKEERFCYEYVLSLNATKAAILAGYSKKTAYSIGGRLLKKVEIQNRINELRLNLSETAKISALRVLKEHEKIAFSDGGQLRSSWLKLKEFEQLTDEQKACIQEITSREVKRITDNGDTIIESWVKIKMYDKQKSLDSISTMLGFNAPEKRELTGKGGKDLVIEPITIEIIDSRDKVDAKETNYNSI